MLTPSGREIERGWEGGGLNSLSPSGRGLGRGGKEQQESCQILVLKILMLVALLGALICPHASRADDGTPGAQGKPDLVKQANAPVSSILQVRLQDTWQPEFAGTDGLGNVLTLSVTMPFPKYRLLPLPQLSLLTIPAAVTMPGGLTGFGDVRFLDIAVFPVGNTILWGVGPTFVFPTSSRPETGQGKWQVGPAAAVAFGPEKWLVGVLVQNPVSFAGDSERKDVNIMTVQPFVTYQLGNGWFIRSQPQIVINWKNGNQQLPLDIGFGRVFTIGGQNVNCFVEPFWNITHDGLAPKYGITFGISLLYPDFWQEHSRRDRKGMGE